MPRPARISGWCTIESLRLWPNPTKDRLPDSAYNSAIPNSRNDDAAADNSMYLILASVNASGDRHNQSDQTAAK